MRKIAIAVLLSAFVAAPAVAADFYAGVKLGTVNYGYRNITNNDQVGLGLLGGFTINENFAVEAEYNNLGGFDAGPSNFKGSSLGVSGVGSFPLNQQFSLFGKLGVASTSLKQTGPTRTSNNTSLTVGIGAQFNVTPVVGVRVGYDSYQVGDSASGTSSAGMMYVGGVFKF